MDDWRAPDHTASDAHGRQAHIRTSVLHVCASKYFRFVNVSTAYDGELAILIFWPHLFQMCPTHIE